MAVTPSIPSALRHRWPWLVAALAFVLASGIQRQVFEGLPHVQDEQAYLWQAKVFAAGALTAPAPPDQSAFLFLFLKVFPAGVAAIFPPGWPWVLALFERVGLAQLAGPSLLACAALLLIRLAQRLGAPLSPVAPPPMPLAPAFQGRHDPSRMFSAQPGPEEAQHLPWLAGLLFLMCSQVLFMAGTWMAHTLCLTLTLIILISGQALLSEEAAASRASRRGWHALALGGAIGLLAATRPVDALGVGAPFLLGAAVRVARKTLSWQVLAQLGGAALPPLLALLLYNATLTGSPWTFPQDLYFTAPPDGHAELLEPARAGEDPPYRFSPTCNALGFGPDRGCAPTFGSYGHTPGKALKILALTAQTFDRQLPGTTGALLLVLPGLWRWRRRLGLCFGPLLLIPGLYALYWYHGLAYGARFWTPVIPMALLGLAGTLAWAAEGLRHRLAAGWRSRVGSRHLLALFLTVLLARQSGFVAAQVREYSDAYWCVDGRIARLKQQLEAGPPALLLVAHTGLRLQPVPLSSAPDEPCRCTHLLRSGAGVMSSSPFLTDSVLVGYLPERQDDVAQLRRLFPSRTIFLYIYDGISGREELLELSNEGLIPRQTGVIGRDATDLP